MTDDSEFVDTRYAKTADYSKDLKESGRKKVCPLCTLEWHTNPILNEQNGWFITRTTQPYKDSKEHEAQHHFLLIPRRHIEKLSEIATIDSFALFSLINWAMTEFEILGGGIAMRFGPTSYTGATVKHLHMHFVVPQIENGQAVPVYFPFG